MFSRFEQKSLSLKKNENENNDNNDDKMTLILNNAYMFVIAIERFIIKYYKTILRIFVRVFNNLITNEFKSQIRIILIFNYKISNFMYFDTNNFQ